MENSAESKRRRLKENLEIGVAIGTAIILIFHLVRIGYRMHTSGVKAALKSTSNEKIT